MNAQATEEEEAAKRARVRKRFVQVRRERTDKNGIQVRFSMTASNSGREPRRYSSIVKPRLPAPGKTTEHASQISKLCS